MSRKKEPYSAFTSIYIKETAENFRRCVKSVFAQSIPPDEMVVVCDGPLTNEMERAIDEELARHSNINLVRLSKNCGRPVAFQAGNDACKNDLIMKIGSDDCCRRNRAELQLEEFSKDRELAACGGYMQSYHEVIGDSSSIRKVPLDLEGIKKFAKRRNPFNDATVMYRKSAFNRIGGYDFKLKRAQDYDLYARMIQAGFKLKNIPVVLTDAQEDANSLLRRKSIDHLKCSTLVRWKIFRSGYSSFLDFMVPTAANILIFILPVQMVDFIFNKMLREEA